MKHSEQINVSVEGHVKITSYDDLESRSNPRVELDKRNAVHPENMSTALARGIAGLQSGHLYTLHFGTGGATVDTLSSIVYSAPNTSGAADLNTPIYSEVVDTARGAPTGNSANVRHVSSTVYSDVEVRCILDKNEPAGQATVDNVTTDLAGNFIFDEMGLKTDDGLLLTHITFNPVEKTSNRVFEVIYTLRITVS